VLQDLVHPVVQVVVPGTVVVLVVGAETHKILEQQEMLVLVIQFMRQVVKRIRLISHIMIHIGAVVQVEQPVVRVDQDQLGQQERQEVLDHRARLAQPVVRDRLEQLAQQGQPERLGQQGQQEHRVHKDQLYQVQQILLG
jgi:hypothetical protein